MGHIMQNGFGVIVGDRRAGMAELSDLEITKRCAAVMGIKVESLLEDDPWPLYAPDLPGAPNYNPLHDDAQALALVKRLTLQLEYREPDWNVYWRADWFESEGGAAPKSIVTEDTNLNRAICLVVAQLQAGSR
jgi:hypothetical protein